MTLCIAAVSMKEQKVVAVCDQMFSNNISSVESNFLKVANVGITGRWIEMFAGDPSVNLEIVINAGRRLGDNSKEEADDISEAFAAAFKEVLRRKIDGEVLSRFGLSMAEFLKDGRANFGDEEFGRIVEKINSAKLHTNILLAGFQPNGTARIISIEDPGVPYFNDMLGFHAIGCGDALANASLMADFSPTDYTLPETIYRLLEAKFRSEKAPGVGRKTFVVVLGKDGQKLNIGLRSVEIIRALWEAKGRPRIPEETDSLVRDILVGKFKTNTESST